MKKKIEVFGEIHGMRKQQTLRSFQVLVCLKAFAMTLLWSCSVALSLMVGMVLLEVKNSINDSKGYLSNWMETDESPCHWTGISCSHREKRVISLNLPYMQLGGVVSPSICRLTKLERLALHQNSLHGYIPIEISQCTELRALYLRGNYFQGGIPSNLGNLSMLTILDLSSNALRGAIPSSLGRLTHLAHLNLSANFLSGEIPDVGVLSKFRSTSFSGNLELCGWQVDKPCRTSFGFPAVLPHGERDEPTVHKRSSSHYIKALVIGAISALGFASIALVCFLWIRLLTQKERAARRYTEVKKQIYQEPKAKLITFHGDLPYTSTELVEKIESLDEQNVIGAGGFGTVYKMVMNDHGTFAVKKIDRSKEGSDQLFERELEMLGSIMHINLVNLRGYCRLPTSKLLIYDYLPLGSLDDLLHDNAAAIRLLNWNARLRIAIGSAKGLAYLHHDCSPRIVHSDIKSSNILLDENLEPHVSDFGLARLLIDEEAHVTTVVAGTFGYLAPEWNSYRKIGCLQLRVLLLELVTGKRPTDPVFAKRGLNIVGWMNTLLRENQLQDVVDERCHDAEPETVEVIVEIAIRCTDGSPEERPSMQQVLQFFQQEVMSPCLSELYESRSDKS